MRKAIVLVVILTALVSLCIGQEKGTEEWTVDQWKDHLFLANPSMDQTTSSMAEGLRNIEELTPGTYIVFKGTARGFFQGQDVPYDMTMSVTVLDKEVVSGQECVVAEIIMDMIMEIEGQSTSMIFTAKEWIDTDGTLVEMDGEMKMSLADMETTMELTTELVGEEQYKGYDCWVYSVTQSTEMMGITMDMEMTQYMDKESYGVVGAIVDGNEVEMGQESLEAATYMQEAEWELGGRETIN
jgi:roadblock/LC7 domain-containing protein